MSLITNLSPPSGVNVEIDGVVSFDVIDPVIEELRIYVWAVFANGSVELVYDTTSFQPTYSTSSVTSTTGGRTFSIRRVGGWTSQPGLRVDTCACPPGLSESVQDTRTLTAGAGLSGGGDLSADRIFHVGANLDASIIVNTDDIQVGVLASDSQHGTRGGDTQHTVAVASGDAGFMSGTDKSKLDGISAGAVSAHGGLSGLDTPSHHTWASLVDGSRAFTGDVTMNSNLLLVGTDPDVRIGIGTGSPEITFAKKDDGTASIRWDTDTGSGFHSHWITQCNANEDFVFLRRDPDGTPNDTPLAISFATGDALFKNSVTLANAAVSDAPALADDLVIGDGTFGPGITLFGSSATSGSIVFTDTAATQIGQLAYDHNQQRFEWMVEGGNEMVLSAARLEPATDGGLNLGGGGVRWGTLFVDTVNADVEITGIQYEKTRHNWSQTGTALVYVPINNLAASTNITFSGSKWVMEHDGEVDEIVVRTQNSGGNTVIGVHLNDNTTAVETDSQTQSSATGIVYSFTSATAFSKGAALHISFNPTTATFVTTVTVRYKLDTRT